MPIFAGIILFIILLILRRINNFKPCLFQVMYVTFFFFHVEVAFQIMTAFSCIEFMGETVHADELSLQCDGKGYNDFLFKMIIPSGVAWLILFPLALFITERWQKRHIQ